MEKPLFNEIDRQIIRIYYTSNIFKLQPRVVAQYEFTKAFKDFKINMKNTKLFKSVNNLLNKIYYESNNQKRRI